MISPGIKNRKENTVDNIGYILYTIARNTKEDLVMPVISRFEIRLPQSHWL